MIEMAEFGADTLCVVVPLIAAMALLWVRRRSRFRMLIWATATVMVADAALNWYGATTLAGAVAMLASGMATALWLCEWELARSAHRETRQTAQGV